MKRILLRTEKLLTTELKYYLTVTYTAEYSDTEMYGVEIRQTNGNKCSYSVEEVDYRKERIMQFINQLAEGTVFPEDLREMCEDYVDMLESRGISK